MASTADTSGSQTSFQSSFSSMKYQYPPVFKRFLVQLVRSLNNDDRAAFKIWCLGLIPGSKLDRDIATDADVYNLIELLLYANELSFTDMSLLNAFLSSIGRQDLLQELQKVELRIFTGMILEDYLKFKTVHGLRQGRNYMKRPPDGHTHIVEFLLNTKEEDQELIKLVPGPLRQFEDLHNILEILYSILRRSQLSWSVVSASLVIIGELYASFSASSGGVNASTDGYFMSLFSETKISEALAAWMARHGGLKTYEDVIKDKQRALINESVLSSVRESLRENIELLGNRVDIQD